MNLFYIMFGSSFLWRTKNDMSTLTQTSLQPPKPYHSYSELVEILESRGMVIRDKSYAEKKLRQIGYYRLSGFWYISRIIQPSPLPRLEQFQPNTNFQNVVQLYIFDKKLRQLMLDGIERIEICIRSLIAHEMGYHDPLAYKSPKFILSEKQNDWTDKLGKTRNSWEEWSSRHDKQIANSKEDCIRWHRDNKKEMPFWVVIEVWDFGLMSQYYAMLSKKYKNRISNHLLPKNNAHILENWLREINTLRNRCAHHTRIWNQKGQALPVPNGCPNDYFKKLSLDDNARKRIYGLISVIWFLLKQIAPSSNWISDVADLIDNKPSLPGCSYHSMGFSEINLAFLKQTNK